MTTSEVPTRPSAGDVFTIEDGRGPSVKLDVNEVVGEEVRGWLTYGEGTLKEFRQPYKTTIKQWKETWL